ncbi:MAG: RNA-binding protein [Acidobacteria bacterium]|nr:MAG: RNA-binding protein [Acidobacteriota bacterium]
MNRRHCLKNLLQVAGGCYLPFFKLFSQVPVTNGQTGLWPQYVDLAEKAGLNSKTIILGHETKDFLLSTTGGGVALFDYDNDGWLDVFLVNGWGLGEFSKGTEPTNHLFRNNHNGTFTDVTEKAGLVRHGWGQGVCVGDYDNDGHLDLFVTYYGKNVLYHNNGNGTFTDVTRESGLLQSEDHWNTGAAFLDYDRDGHVDLFVSNYVGYQYGLTLYDSNPSLVSELSPVLYGVAGLEGTHNILYRNNGDGTFANVSDRAGILKPEPAYGFTPCVADFDNDGWPDIYVADDSTPSLLFLNNRDGSFRETGLLAGVAFDANGRSQGGMGVDAGDYDGDGLFDIIKTNFSDETPSLYHNDGRGFFTDATSQGGLAGQASSVKWGTAFFDYDNDGRPDLLIVTGPIYPPGVSSRNSKLGQGSRMILCRNLGNGRFEDISTHAGPALSQSRCSRGAAFGDIFHTGQIDIVVNNVNDRPGLLRNQSPSANAWLLVNLVGTKTNRAAIGSRVLVETENRRQIQEVRSGGSFCSHSDLRLHFGLGKARVVTRIEVQWLSGSREVLERVPVNRLVTLQEGKGIISQDAF